MAHFDIPLDLPHASRLAERVFNLLERIAQESGVDAPDALDLAEGLSTFLYRFSDLEDTTPEAYSVRDEAAAMARQLVDAIEQTEIRNDRLGQFIRNLFECLELGKEGAEISLRAGEDPNSLQRPY